MTLDEDMDSFRIWATKLACPPASIPNEDAIKTMFKCRQRDLFRNLMKCVMPRQDVAEFRENILITEMQRFKQQLIPQRMRSTLPKEMQIYMKMNDLNKQKASMEGQLQELKKEYEKLAASIKTKNIQSMSLEHKAELLEHRTILLKLKSESLGNAIQKEEEIKERINKTMPVKLTEKNANEKVAMEAVEKALFELKDFYNLHYSNINSNLLQEAKDDLWKTMRNIFANIPNFLLFNALLRIKEVQLQNVTTLNKSTVTESHTHSFNSGYSVKEPFSLFELKLMRTKADLLGLVAKFLAARQERVTLEENFCTAYGPFVNELQNKVLLLSSDTDLDSDAIISDYIEQYNLMNFSKSQNEFLKTQIELYKSEIESGSKQLDSHEVLLGTIRQVYSDIDISINRIRYEMVQLDQIKEKILYSKNMLKVMLDDMQATSVKSNFVTTKLKISPNLSPLIDGGISCVSDSFDNVMCSTKLDFETTLNSTSMRRSFNVMDTTLSSASIIATDGGFKLPPYTLELNTFIEIPLEKFYDMSKECAFHVASNPFIIETSELSSTIQLAPGSILTPYGALQEVRNRIVWANLIAEHSNDLKLDLNLILINPLMLKERNKKQKEHIIEILDKIDSTAINTLRILNKTTKLYDFMLENPLRQHIPPKKLVNNQHYKDYENEFNMYYRMATKGNSIG